MEENELEIIDNTTEENENIAFRYSITSYGADYTVDSIVSRVEKEKIFVPPFQRNYVWNQRQASRFIESLILGLPVPGIFLSKENKTGRLLIIDGQQRILSIANFYKGVFGKRKFTLKGVQEDLEGLTYEDLREADQNRLDDSILHATIVKQDTPSEDDSSIYMVFERLNTGGTPLQVQEIRACIYYGEFNEMLSELIKHEDWKQIFGNKNTRMKEQELILRFFALYFEYQNYTKPLKSFLNSFMAKHRNLEIYSHEELYTLFDKTIKTVFEAIGLKVFRTGEGSRINAAIFDSIMVGVAKRLQNNQEVNLTALKGQYEQLLENEDFLKNIKSGTSDVVSVKGRIEKSIEAFKNI